MSIHSLSAHSYNVPPAYSFPRSRKEKNRPRIPGPGDYFPLNRYWSPSFSISKSRRQLSDYKSTSPGPGFYSYSTKESKHFYSISKALNKSNEIQKPVTLT